MSSIRFHSFPRNFFFEDGHLEVAQLKTVKVIDSQTLTCNTPDCNSIFPQKLEMQQTLVVQVHELVLSKNLLTCEPLFFIVVTFSEASWAREH
jgi:hypothetical protein